MNNTNNNLGFVCDFCSTLFLDIETLRSHECKNESCRPKQNVRWTPSMVKCFIGLYQEHEKKFYQMTYKTRQVFDIIAEDMKTQGFTNVDGEACHSKWRSLKKCYKNNKDKKKASGNGAVPVSMFFDQMDAILGKKPDIQPEATYNSSHTGPIYRDNLLDFTSHPGPSSSYVSNEMPSTNIRRSSSREDDSNNEKSQSKKQKLPFWCREYFKKIDHWEEERLKEREKRREERQARHEENKKMRKEYLLLLKESHGKA